MHAGGHSSAGQSSCDGGFMIDLAPLNSVQVDSSARIARVGSGALVGQLDRATSAHGLATTAGTCTNTGLGGYALGGGLGRVSRRFGLGCDNLRAAELITAAGQMVRASAHELENVSGGCAAAAAILASSRPSSMTYTHSEPTVLRGVILWPLAQAKDVLHLLCECTRRAELLHRAALTGQGCGDDRSRCSLVRRCCPGRQAARASAWVRRTCQRYDRAHIVSRSPSEH
ncbi:MAG: FAD-binding protein [Steroidobacteraceae bacterium]